MEICGDAHICRVSEIVHFDKNCHSKKLGEIEVIYAVWVCSNDEFQLKALSLSHLYSVFYYQKTVGQKLIENSL